MKKAVINFAHGAWYPEGQTRLKESLKVHDPSVDFFGIQNFAEIGSPTHTEVPYAFKVFCFLHCKNLGYDMVIYADASIYATKPWTPIWDITASQGYYIEAAGHYVGSWTKDSVLKKYGISRDEAMTIPMFSAGFTALNFKEIKSLSFLQSWHDACIDGDSFIGSWTNKNGEVSADKRCHGHRHDMSVASILAYRLNMNLGGGGHFLSYIGPGYGTPSKTTVASLKPC